MDLAEVAQAIATAIPHQAITKRPLVNIKSLSLLFVVLLCSFGQTTAFTEEAHTWIRQILQESSDVICHNPEINAQLDVYINLLEEQIHNIEQKITQSAIVIEELEKAEKTNKILAIASSALTLTMFLDKEKIYTIQYSLFNKLGYNALFVLCSYLGIIATVNRIDLLKEQQIYPEKLQTALRDNLLLLTSLRLIKTKIIPTSED